VRLNVNNAIRAGLVALMVPVAALGGTAAVIAGAWVVLHMVVINFGWDLVTTHIRNKN
jgi:hypothetical protein